MRAHGSPAWARWLVLALVLALPVAARAEPAKRQAQELMTEGVSLLRAKRYSAALAKFQAAYARYPSPKILLNIGTTLKDMGRLADAANTYHEYIGDPTTPPERLVEVKKILAELDAQLVLLTVEVSPAGSEVSIDGRPWQSIARALVTRVSPGARLVRARGSGLDSEEQSFTAGPGEARTISFALEAERPLAVVPVTLAPPAASRGLVGDDDASVHARAPLRRDGGQHIGVSVQARIDGELRGAAASVGLAYEPIPSLQIELAALLSDVYGGYLGARFRLLPTVIRPHLAAGVPLFFSDGPRIAGRIAAGAELELGDHILVVAEAGYEHFANPEPGYETNVFVPVVGLVGRL